MDSNSWSRLLANFPASVAALVSSRRSICFTDLLLVRKVCDGSWRMVSGHRRKAAYALLAKGDPAYERMPYRVIEGIDDEWTVTLFHAANYFTHALTVIERAAVTWRSGATPLPAFRGPHARRHARRRCEGCHHRAADGPQGVRQDHRARRDWLVGLRRISHPSGPLKSTAATPPLR